jgi:RNA polymerase-interacting CarD/CdnL/TRCF family regulator
MGGLFGAIAAIAAIVLYLMKRHDSPETKQRRILEKTDDTLNRFNAALAKGDTDRIADMFADLNRDIMLETTTARDSYRGPDDQDR